MTDRSWVHVHGEGPLVIAHPDGPGLDWEYLRMPLLERENTVAYVEPAGDLASSVEQLDAVVAEYAQGPVFVLGHGYGGFAAQKFALEHPDRLDGLILYATAAVSNAWTTSVARENLQRHASAEALAAWDRPPGADEAEATRRFREIFPAWFADYAGREAEFAPLRDRIRSRPLPQSDFDVRPELGEIAVPVLILAGEQDFAYGPESARQLSGGLPAAEVVLFPQSGHLAHLEEADRFAQTVAHFLAEAPTGGRAAPPRPPTAGGLLGW